MDKWELTHWLAHLRLNPPLVDQLRSYTAVIRAAINNENPYRSWTLSASDCLIDWREKPPTPQERAEEECRAWKRWALMCQAQEKSEA